MTMVKEAEALGDEYQDIVNMHTLVTRLIRYLVDLLGGDASMSAKTLTSKMANLPGGMASYNLDNLYDALKDAWTFKQSDEHDIHHFKQLKSLQVVTEKPTSKGSSRRPNPRDICYLHPNGQHTNAECRLQKESSSKRVRGTTGATRDPQTHMMQVSAFTGRADQGSRAPRRGEPSANAAAAPCCGREKWCRNVRASFFIYCCT